MLSGLFKPSFGLYLFSFIGSTTMLLILLVSTLHSTYDRYLLDITGVRYMIYSNGWYLIGSSSDGDADDASITHTMEFIRNELVHLNSKRCSIDDVKKVISDSVNDLAPKNPNIHYRIIEYDDSVELYMIGEYWASSYVFYAGHCNYEPVVEPLDMIYQYVYAA